jgi:sec-independent protein translocase protein TatA
VIIALVVLVLFGYKKLPEMSRSVGRSLRIFKTEIKGMGQDDAARESAETAVPPTDQPTTASTPVVVAPVLPPAVVVEPTSAAAPVAQPLPPVVEEPHPSLQKGTQA